jgi:two-component system response regulator FixJ
MDEFCLVQIDTRKEKHLQFAMLLEHSGLPWRCYAQLHDLGNIARCGDVIVFIYMGGNSSIEDIAQLCAFGISTVVYSDDCSLPLVFRCLRAGAMDFFEWRNPAEFNARLNVILCRHELLRDRHAQRAAAAEQLSELTAREKQVLCAVLAGGTSKTIGRLFDISFRTVEIHRKNLREKLGCQHTGDLFSFGVQAGLLGPDAAVAQPFFSSTVDHVG